MMKLVNKVLTTIKRGLTFIKEKSFLSKIRFPDLSENPKIKFLNKYSLIFHAILACSLVFVIEWVSRHSFTSTVSFCFHGPLTYLYNVLLIFASLLIVYIFKRRALVRVVISVFWLLLGVINGCILASRVTPFNFTDLKLVGDLLAMKGSKYFTTGQEIAVVVSLICLGIFILFMAVRGPKFPGRVHRIRNAACLALCVIAIPFITRAAIQSDILAGYFGNLAQGYKDYGFVYSFASSVVDTGMNRPDNYSEETIAQINDSVKTEETSIDKNDLPNIIFVQLETFIDPYELKFLQYSEDPIPNFRKLMNKYSSGHVTVPVVGAGTANTEFEMLTGMGIRFFGLGEYPYKTVLKDTTCESAADILSDIGYSTHALHNNGGNFYSRAKIFSQMGFDTFTSKELMNITEYNAFASWPLDDILLDETAKTLDSTKDQSDFLFTITVQSHGSYPDYPIYENPPIKVTGGETEGENYQWEYYVNQLHEVDAFVGKLVDELSKRDEKTLLVLYGDHLPTMGLEDEDMARGNLFETSYATWNNFGMEKEDADLAAYQMMAHFMDRLGIHEGTIFRYHQSEMDGNGSGLTDTVQTDMDQADADQTETDQAEDTYIANWELLQYDLLYGNRYSYHGIDKYPASDLVMGVEDVILKDIRISPDGAMINLEGENFTPWSKVYINDEKVPTHYNSSTSLQISLEDITDGAAVVVNQVGSGSTIFRSSNTVIFQAPPDFEELKTAAASKDETVADTSEEDLSGQNDAEEENTENK